MLELLSNSVKSDSDLDYILELSFKLFSKPSGLSPKQEYRRIVEPWLTNPALGLVMAYHSGSPVGFVLHRPIPDFERKLFEQAISQYPEIQYNEESRVIDVIAVDTKSRRKGFGISLVKRMEEDLRNATVHQLYATCWKGENGESYPLLKKLGYKELKHFRGCYADNSDGIAVMKSI